MFQNDSSALSPIYRTQFKAGRGSGAHSRSPWRLRRAAVRPADGQPTPSPAAGRCLVRIPTSTRCAQPHRASTGRPARAPHRMNAVGGSSPGVLPVITARCTGRGRWLIVRRAAGCRRLCVAGGGRSSAASRRVLRGVRPRRCSSGHRPSRRPRSGGISRSCRWSAADTDGCACA